MKRVFLLLPLLLLAACNRDPYAVENPDPNHTHADFAIWIGNQQLDFSGEDYMSGAEAEETDEDHEEHGHAHHPYLHLHDGIGTLVHRHKPGLSLGEFLGSLGVLMRTDDNCLVLEDGSEQCSMQMIVNGKNMPFDPEYVFEDLDTILLTDASTPELSASQEDALTDDACLFSQRCSWRGDPPAENCVADPAVPCVAPLD